MTATATKAAPKAATAPKAEAAVPAPAPAASFTFGDAAVPAVTRKSTAVNPLLDVCKSIAETMKDGRSTVAKTVNSANAEQTKKIKRWLALAGKEIGVTFRSVVDETKDAKGKVTGFVVTFWAVERIEHKDRKPRNGNGHNNK